MWRRVLEFAAARRPEDAAPRIGWSVRAVEPAREQAEQGGDAAKPALGVGGVAVVSAEHADRAAEVIEVPAQPVQRDHGGVGLVAGGTAVAVHVLVVGGRDQG